MITEEQSQELTEIAEKWMANIHRAHQNHALGANSIRAMVEISKILLGEDVIVSGHIS